MDIIKKIKKSMGGNLAAELEDWSFAPSNHPSVAKNQRRVNGIQIPLTLGRFFAALWRFSPPQITPVWRKSSAESTESGFH